MRIKNAYKQGKKEANQAVAKGMSVIRIGAVAGAGARNRSLESEPDLEARCQSQGTEPRLGTEAEGPELGYLE